MFPVNNPVGAVIEDAHIGNIDSVFVKGRAVKRHGKLIDVDVKALRRRVEASVDGLFERAHVKRDGNWLPDPYVGGTDAKVDKKLQLSRNSGGSCRPTALSVQAAARSLPGSRPKLLPNRTDIRGRRKRLAATRGACDGRRRGAVRECRKMTRLLGALPPQFALIVPATVVLYLVSPLLAEGSVSGSSILSFCLLHLFSPLQRSARHW